MKIALSQYRPAIRLFKWAQTLTNIGHHVTVFMAYDPVKGLPWDRFRTARLQKVNRFTGFDVHVSFNTSTEYSIPASNIPTIQAVGDVAAMSATETPGKAHIERDALSRAVATTFVSKAQREVASEIHGEIPHPVIIYNAPLREFIGELKCGKTGGLVYMGTVTSFNGNHRNITDRLLHLYDQYKSVIHLYPYKSVIHVYPSVVSSVPMTMFDNPAFQVHDSVTPDMVVTELSQYTHGIIEINSDSIARVMMPNKLFEYLAAGLTVILPDNMTAIQTELKDAPSNFDSQAAKLDELLTFAAGQRKNTRRP
jgi:hypothetical protein